MKRFLLLICLFVSMLAHAQNSAGVMPNEAELKALYDKEQYTQAIEGYRELLRASESAPSAALYYNLGNAYYRNGELGWAILSYERALRLAPRDKYVQHNLQIAASQTTDRVEYYTSYSQSVWHSICYALPPTAWMVISLFLFILLAVATLAFVFMRKKVIRQVAFYTSLASLVLFIFCVFVTRSLELNYRDGSDAIIIEGQVAAKSAPSGATTTLFVLHEGSKVKLEDLPEENGQVAITLPDGTLGWVSSKALLSIYPFSLNP
nr:tetratricopeptide repeat protein [uncultured Porphyromonas sp.]